MAWLLADERLKMTVNINDREWDTLSHDEKNRELYFKQKDMLDQFLERRAISQAQYDKSLHDLTEKMGMQEE